LKDATIQITSRGDPKFIAGKTPPVKPRPYVHFYETNAAAAVILLGRDNPTRASSEAEGHAARLANDGNAATYWQAESGDANPWFRVDLERVVTLSKTKLTFPAPGNWHYRIEISDSGDSWKLLVDQSAAAGNAAERTDIVTPGAASGRFVRISIVAAPAGRPAGLAELEFSGAQSGQ
jgi:hypothetical protein